MIFELQTSNGSDFFQVHIEPFLNNYFTIFAGNANPSNINSFVKQMLKDVESYFIFFFSKLFDKFGGELDFVIPTISENKFKNLFISPEPVSSVVLQKLNTQITLAKSSKLYKHANSEFKKKMNSQINTLEKEKQNRLNLFKKMNEEKKMKMNIRKTSILIHSENNQGEYLLNYIFRHLKFDTNKNFYLSCLLLSFLLNYGADPSYKQTKDTICTLDLLYLLNNGIKENPIPNNKINSFITKYNLGENMKNMIKSIKLSEEMTENKKIYQNKIKYLNIIVKRSNNQVTSSSSRNTFDGNTKIPSIGELFSNSLKSTFTQPIVKRPNNQVTRSNKVAKVPSGLFSSFRSPQGSPQSSQENQRRIVTIRLNNPL